jgi:hypothetical protein
LGPKNDLLSRRADGQVGDLLAVEQDEVRIDRLEHTGVAFNLVILVLLKA